MHIIGILELIVQIYFAVHAGRTGRYWWIFIILFFPLIGSIIYFFVEYLPEMNSSRIVNRSRTPGKPKSIKVLERELKITDSVKNRMNLAEAYFHSGRYRESVDLLEKSLSGIHANDLDIIEGLCFSHYGNDSLDKTLEYLSRYEMISRKTIPNHLRLIRAKTYEANGDIEKAITEYSEIAGVCSGEEARCRYALLLKRQGETDKAAELFSTILKNAKLYPKQYSTFEKKWVRIARAELK